MERQCGFGAPFLFYLISSKLIRHLAVKLNGGLILIACI